MSSLPRRDYRPRTKPVEVFLGCGCIIRVSNRTRAYGECWCYRHRRRVAIVRVIEPAKIPPDNGMTPLF